MQCVSITQDVAKPSRENIKFQVEYYETIVHHCFKFEGGEMSVSLLYINIEYASIGHILFQTALN